MKKTFLILILLLHASFGASLSEIEECDIYFKSGILLKNIPAATTYESHAKGLSNLEDVGNGMIFIFEKSKILSFWMKNTLVPLQIGFFDEKGYLHQIESMKPLSLELHNSKKPSRIAIELKNGEFRNLKIKLGDKIEKLDCK